MAVRNAAVKRWRRRKVIKVYTFAILLIPSLEEKNEKLVYGVWAELNLKKKSFYVLKLDFTMAKSALNAKTTETLSLHFPIKTLARKFNIKKAYTWFMGDSLEKDASDIQICHE